MPDARKHAKDAFSGLGAGVYTVKTRKTQRNGRFGARQMPRYGLYLNERQRTKGWEWGFVDVKTAIRRINVSSFYKD